MCAGLRLDTETLCAALLHDTVEDTSASLADVTSSFGEEIGRLVDGVTKLTGITFQSRDESQAENYRKMMVAMATDIRVILIKLADRLHNMRTLSALSKQKQLEKARETLEIYAPLAHRLGIHAIKWELEDLAFATLHPRKYDEMKKLVAQQRAERERYVEEAGGFLRKELKKVGIEAEISGRAKHFYSIYTKMTRKGREFNEIFDLTAMRVLVGGLAVLVRPVGRDPELGGLVHLARADLDLERPALGPDHRGVERLVHVELGHGDHVLEPPRQRLPEGVHDPDRAVAVLHRADQDTHRGQVEDLVELPPLARHLRVDGVEVLGAA